MPDQPEDNSLESWHRYFAIENNNLAWGLAAQPSRTPGELAQLLDAAHTASLHWGAVGTELNVMRAKTLLAEAHALAGFGDSALALAEEIRSYFLERETDDWEVAYVHTIHAHAACVAGNGDLHRDSYASAKLALEEIADEEDRVIVMETFSQVPPPASIVE